jgi:putative redox protein
MTVRMYADRKKIPLEGVRVELRHNKIHADDCKACETGSGRIDRIIRRVFLKGELSVKQQQKILAIADKCPVHRTLHSEIMVETDLGE